MKNKNVIIPGMPNHQTNFLTTIDGSHSPRISGGPERSHHQHDPKPDS